MRRLQRNLSVFQQTKVLLWKNVLIKWRMKMQSFQEWMLSLLFLPLMFIVSSFMMHTPYPEVPHSQLGQLDDPAYNATGVTIAFTPVTAATRHIMNTVASKSVMTGMIYLLNAWLWCYSTFYTHVLMPFFSIPADTCYNYSNHYCESPKYWYQGFLSLQSSIDAAIIEVVANHSVWEEMRTIAGVRAKSRSVISSITLEYSYFMITVVMCFSSFMYFLSVNVVREKKKLKVLMKLMGLHDMAFWLSWSLLYAIYVLILSCLLTALVVQESFYTSSFSAILLLFFLYGLACIHLVFMLCSLLRTSKLVGSLGFLITFLFGCLSLSVLIENLPGPLKWFLSLFCPFAFNVGIAKIFSLERYGIGFSFSNIMEESYFLLSTYIILTFDSVLYMLLAVYFDKVLQGKYGIPAPPLFCLKPSYWMRSRRGFPGEGHRGAGSLEEPPGDDVEPVPLEFRGKEAIRLHNIKKTYKKKDKKTEALRGLSLDIYEGQITALLGHSGAGKTTLLNVLSGLTLPSEGSATIYDYKLSEIGDREEIREMVGVCPQFDTQFEVLTVKENLQTFAEIKGIKSKEVEREVQNILELLDISSVQDTQAEKLSGGQKRKLSIGIAMLGNPQVLLLDEPTAGLDPLSRHQVWSLLKEHRAGRVILFSTQFMDEADILADRKAFISRGRLKCVGSSLFLKNKWGIGYHLRIHVSDSCDVENVTSLVKQYIPGVMLSGHGQYELRYKLPLENVNKFPDLFRGLDSCSDLGIINYGVSMTTLEDVFLRLEEDAVDHEGTIVAVNTQPSAKTTAALQPPQHRSVEAVSCWALWRQQVSAVAWVRLLKLKSSGCSLTHVLEETLRSCSSTWMILEVPPNSSHSMILFVQHNYTDFLCAVCTKGKSDMYYFRPEFSWPRIFILVSCSLKSYRFTIFCHMEAINCFPVLVNIISNALLRAFNSTIDNPQYWDSFVSFYLIYMLLLFPGFPPHFAMGYLQDYKTGAHAQLRISGLFPSAYWCGQALVDVPFCWLLLISMFGLQFAISNRVSGTFSNFFLLIMNVFGYGVSIIFLIYFISFFFRKGWNCDFWSFILIKCILSKSVSVATSFFQPYIHFVVFVFLLRYLEIKYGRPVLRKDPIFRISPRKENSHQHPEEPEEEDEDVKAEREAVKNAIAAPSQEEKSVIIVNNLYKEYKIKKAGSVFRKKKKIATKNISFCVKKGEVLGLLGPNGAGKSTVINMIAGETTLTAGQVGGYHAFAYLGHCPQEDPLWPDLTVHEQLKVCAAVKGVHKEDIATAINRIVNALELQDYLKKPTRKLPAGITRKLCFAVCMLGNPSVLLLDEPSTGMDPKGQRCIWKMIRAALKTQETGAVLTTHYMEEAEAVCDRVAMLVAGQLQCIGSIQYLKNKFGKGYVLEIKVKDPETTDLLHAEILRIFPSAARQERFPSLLVYKVPMEDALPLSQSFSKLEEGKSKAR
uniref:ABC transporter domain-containing protein n=1 Tax=Chrysolophus pictus TaxID=9089 RepID=A0A8C3L714_CHRPC